MSLDIASVVEIHLYKLISIETWLSGVTGSESIVLLYRNGEQLARIITSITE